MKLAAVMASVLSFFAGVWFMRQYRYHVPAGPGGMRARGLPLYRRDEPSWDYRRVTDDWATDPRTAELATGGGR